MVNKIRSAVLILGGHFVLLCALILTVKLPANLLVNYLEFYVLQPDDTLTSTRMAMWLEGLFGPIYIGALVHALWHIQRGEQIGYAAAITVGLKNWGRLFWARLLARFLILLALLLLIVPGIVLALRYSLLDCAVIIEGADAEQARKRSTQLTIGNKLKILGTICVCMLVCLLNALLMYAFLSVALELEPVSMPVAMATYVLADCVIDLMYGVLQIAIFLFYWEARQAEMRTTEPQPAGAKTIGHGSPDTAPGAPLHDDDNPFALPRSGS